MSEPTRSDADRPTGEDPLPAETAEDLFEHAPCGYLSSRPGGLLVRVNETFLAWTGYRREELVGRRRFQDLLTPGGRIFHETHYAPLLDLQGAVREIAAHFARTTFLSDNRADLARVRTPSLVLQCADDAIAPQAVGEYVHRQIPGSRFVQLEATGHCPNLSAPGETVAAIKAFLAE